MDGELRCCGRGERGTAQSPLATLGDPPLSAPAAPSWLSHLEIPGPAEPSRHVARQVVTQTVLDGNISRFPMVGINDGRSGQPNSLCRPHLARPRSAEISRRRVSRRIDVRSSALGSSNEGDGSRSRDRPIPHGDLAHTSGALSVVSPTINYIGHRYTELWKGSDDAYRFVVAGSGAMQSRQAPVSFADEQRVAASKPCLRQRCGHPHPDHVPSEGMECAQCVCPSVGFARPDDRGRGRHPGGCARCR